MFSTSTTCRWRCSPSKGKGTIASQILLLLALRQTGGETQRRADSFRWEDFPSDSDTATARAARCSAARPLLGFYAGKGNNDETEHPMFRMMVRRLTEWFS